jgi:hypothetical protein
MAIALHDVELSTECWSTNVAEENGINVAAGETLLFIGSTPCRCIGMPKKHEVVQRWLTCRGIAAIHVSKYVYEEPAATMPRFLAPMESET